MTSIRVAPLADHPEYVETCLAWWLAEWGAAMGFTQQSGRAAIESLMRRDKQQIALLGFVDDTPAGGVFLVREDLETHRNLTPWLAALYVRPEFRRKGLGSHMTRSLLDAARQSGFSEIYLYTRIGGYYRQLGWQSVETALIHNQPHEIMRFDLVE